MSYYQKHIFFCTNRRDDDGRASCAAAGAEALQDYAKKKAKSLGLLGEGKIRVNKSGCLDRCEEGPCAVVYPEQVWYRYFDQADVDEIVTKHLVNGEIVERLRI
jgi:(2Fe-2S) ferredoxin